MELLEMKNTESEMKKILDGFSSRLDIQEVKISEFEDIILETIQNKTH